MVWRHERDLRRGAIAIAGLFVCGIGIRLAVNPSNDFRNHWTWGARIIRNEFLYAGGANVPYPPFWAAAHAPFALMPLAVAQVVMFVLGVIAVAVLIAVLQRLTARSLPLDDRRIFWTAAAALALSSRFVHRDLLDGGPNLCLLALTWIALGLWTRGRAGLGGALLGLAIALKLTSLLFVPYFLWRRHWQMAVATLVAALAFTLAPAIRQGAAVYEVHVRVWSTALWQAATEPDPRVGVLGLERTDNLSLRPALARFLTLPPATARRIIVLLTAALVAAVAAAIGFGAVAPSDPRAVWDLAAIGILALLLSPITWRQHAVAVLPACYLIARLGFVRGGLPRFTVATLVAVIAAIVILNPVIAGDRIVELVHAYYLYTWSFIALIAATLQCRYIHTSPMPNPSWSGSLTSSTLR